MADMPEITHTEPSQVLLDPSAFSLPPRARNIAQKRKTGLELKLEKPGPADWARIHPDGTGGSGGGPEANTNSTGSRFSAATSTPFGIAVDRNGNLWMANSGASGTVADTYSSISYLAVSNNSSTGTGGIMSSVTSTSTAGGLNIPQDIEIDGNNNAWVANYTQNAIGVGAVPYQISEFSFNGTTIVPVTSGGLSTGTASAVPSVKNARGVAIDASGNIWIANNNSAASYLTVLVGAAGPVITPKALAVGAKMIGQKP